MLSEERKKRILELEKRSFDRNIFTFTDFLSPSSLAGAKDIISLKSATFFGGCDFAERQMIRFGKIEDLGYEEEFPISILKISVKGEKFATKITHRDVLGAIIGLGIERQKLGDMFVNEGVSYIIASETVSKLILEELKSVGRNAVTVEEVKSVPSGFEPKTKEVEFSVSSNRVDGVICKVYNLSRESALSLFPKGFVAINGKPCEVPSKTLKEGDVVTVRGEGKFTFLCENGFSKKGKLYVLVSVSV